MVVVVDMLQTHYITECLTCNITCTLVMTLQEIILIVTQSQ